MSHVDRIHPNVALATAVGIYSLLFRLINPPDTTASRFMKSREAISLIYCILTLCAISFELYRQRDNWVPPSFRPNQRTDYVTAISEGQAHARIIHMIEASPPFTNAIISYECGYLIQDFIVFVMGARRVAIDKRARPVMARNINWRILGWHHLGIASALGLFHFRALEGRAKGSLVIMMMLLMDAS
ncbi:hypothetical protein DTO027I6_9907 [Penicillium roqueforti]|nr:hypothetical protein CBS147337_9985 [Penicillium roqueforti]KAI3184992.1 hypothetical protein DTO027I6_9907 [Penicillium roqueforti]